jgi:transcriptional regulator with XRE-family HTH domain
MDMSTHAPSTVGDRVRAARIARGWTQVDLAYHARLSAAEVSRVETGRTRPYPRQAERIARALGLSVHDVFGEVAA